jgi:hypothetical protein
MSCSICQSMTFQATAGSRLDGSVRYESVSVPPCLGVLDDELGLPMAPPLELPPQAARASERARRAARIAAARIASVLSEIGRCVIPASLEFLIRPR